MTDNYRFPQAVMFEFDKEKTNDPVRTKMFGEQRLAQLVGVIKGNKFVQSPGNDWTLTMEDHGKYTINHPTSQGSYNLSFNLIDPTLGNIKLISMCDKKVVLETYNKEGSLADLDFLFCMSTIRKIA